MNTGAKVLAKLETTDKTGIVPAINEVNKKATKPVGLKGQSYFIKEDGTEVILDNLLKVGDFVETADELSFAQSKTVSMQEVFNQWTRFSHNNTAAQPAVAAELNSWTFNALTNRITCTVNSVSHIGFVSKEKFSRYTHEVKLSSTAADDDIMGVVIAFAVDASGREHTLTAIRDHQGQANTWRIHYNFSRSDAKIIANGSASIIDGGNWSLHPNGTKVKITRDEDIITAVTTQVDSNAYVPASLLTVDLTSDPVLAIFRGPCSYGYSCHSQDSTTFSEIVFTNPSSAIFDVVTGDVWSLDSSGAYVKNTEIKPSDLTGRVLLNKETMKAFYVSGDMQRKILQSTETKLLNFTLGAGATQDINASQLFECPLNAKHLDVEVRQLISDGASPFNSMYVKNETNIVVGYNTTTIKVRNTGAASVSLELLIRR